MAEARVPTDEELRRITERAVAEIIPREQFVEMLMSGRALRLKMGFDPSAPDLTLGHAVGLRKLRQLQELGHTVVVIVGDWTARIGDPSGLSKTRPMLSEGEVRENAETYLRQFFKIVDRELTEIRRQSEWFDPFTLTDVVQLAGKFTVAQMMEREDFAQRFKEGHPIGVHELLYPLLQAYDSVAVKADVEFGGTDQKFNLHVGRELQPAFGQPAQAIYLVPLLVGTDGKVKMSKSLGNYIALEEPANETFGKVMSVPDSLIDDYFTLVTDVPDEELETIRHSVQEGGEKSRDAKMRLAREIVSQFHSAEAAEAAEREFMRTFSERGLPEDVREFAVQFPEGGPMEIDLLEVLASSGAALSRSEARRLLQQGAIEADGERVTEGRLTVRPGTVLRIGKHRFLRLVDVSSRAEEAAPPRRASGRKPDPPGRASGWKPDPPGRASGRKPDPPEG